MQKKNTRKNWHLKSAKRGSVYLQKKYVQNEAVSICKKSTCKIGTLNLQNEAARICRKSTRKNWHVKSAKRGSVYLHKKYQRWSPRGRPWPRGRPRGHILKSLALASKVKSLALALASRPQVLENWPVLGSRTARFFGMLKFCGALEKFFGKRFFSEDRLKIFVKTFFFFFFLENTCALCPWSLASSIPVLGLESVCPRKGCPWPWPRIFFVSLALALASSLVSSTPPLKSTCKTRQCLSAKKYVQKLAC